MAISGIQNYRYKKLQERLKSISEINLTDEQFSVVKNHLDTLDNLYGNYKQMIGDVLDIIVGLHGHATLFHKSGIFAI